MRPFLNVYARVMCRAIWAARKFIPAREGELPNIAVTKRDFEWSGKHRCENCGKKCRHRFIDWNDEDVTTAECSRCGFEGTL